MENNITAQELAELGLDKAASKLSAKATLQKKLMIAYEHYRFVTPTIFKRFEDALELKTKKVQEACPQCKNHPKKASDCSYCRGTGARVMTHDTLVFVKLAEYGEVPPKEVLGKLKEAKDRQCFDRFEVAKVQTVEVRPDPIIFGVIDGVPEKFFIAQWDNDVKIEDILQQHEG